MKAANTQVGGSAQLTRAAPNGLLAGCIGAALLVAPLLPGTASAQAYPNIAIRMIVPFPAAGGTDTLGRVIGAKLSEGIGQQVVVENRPGAGGNLGTGIVAAAPGDGYTILMVSSSYSVNPTVFKLTFDPLKDVTAVIQVASVPFVLLANSAFPANNVTELLAIARAKPGSINYASAGNGSAPHLAGELFALMTNTKLVHIPYKGGTPAMTDLVAGQVQISFGTVTLSGSLLKAGKLKALAVGGLTRVPSLPDVPTVNESGVPGFDLTNWFGILAPGTTPKPIITFLNKNLNGILGNAEVRAKLAVEGAYPVGGSADDFNKMIAAEIEKFGRIVKAGNIKID